MLAAGDSLRSAPLWEEAVAVAEETMNRARSNVERLLENLPELGYELWEPERAFVPPPAEVSRRLDKLETTVGVLPLSLRTWFEHVGSVNLMGEHPKWGYKYLDPLVVEFEPDYLPAEFEDWQADRDSETFQVEVAPDYLHKADVSGGGPYGLEVPNEAVDGLFREEFHETTFVDYLRIAFRWAGFPGWERQTPKWARPEKPPPEELRALAAELLPL
jgi:hypothetical protein